MLIAVHVLEHNIWPISFVLKHMDLFWNGRGGTRPLPMSS